MINPALELMDKMVFPEKTNNNEKIEFIDNAIRQYSISDINKLNRIYLQLKLSTQQKFQQHLLPESLSLPEIPTDNLTVASNESFAQLENARRNNPTAQQR